jgi:hypothetical protein
VGRPEFNFRICTQAISVDGVQHRGVSNAGGIAMMFRDWQPQYAEHGIAAFPVRVTDRGKVPAIKGWQRVGLNGSAKLAQKFAGADALGFCLGRRSRLTVLDIDTPDDSVLADALDQHGRTPIIVRSGSGNHQVWYRWNGEGRQIRPFCEKPIDVLGSGFVVAPPSNGTKSNYHFIEGSLDDLDHLPPLRGLPANGNGQLRTAAPQGTERIHEGARNMTLWRHCMRHAHYCDDFDALLDVARTANNQYLPPLSDSEVVKAATSAWGYTERGDNRFGQTGVWLSTEDVNRLIKQNPDDLVLLNFLFANNGRSKPFMIANGMADRLGWPRKRLAAARKRLIGVDVERVKAESSFTGAALYRRKSKGGQK